MNERIIARGLDLSPLWRQMRQRFQFDHLAFEILSPDDPDNPHRRTALLLLKPSAITGRISNVVGPENLRVEYDRLPPDLYSCRLTILGGVRKALMEASKYSWGCKVALNLAAGQFGIGTRVFNHSVDVRVDADEELANPEEVRRTLLERGVIAQ